MSDGYKFINLDGNFCSDSGFVITYKDENNWVGIYNGSGFITHKPARYSYASNYGYNFRMVEDDVIYNYHDTDLIIYSVENYNKDDRLIKITFFIDRKRKHIICSYYHPSSVYGRHRHETYDIRNVNKDQIPNLKSINSTITKQTFYVIMDGDNIVSVHIGLNPKGKPYKKLPKIKFMSYEIKEKKFITKEESFNKRIYSSLDEVNVAEKCNNNINNIMIKYMIDKNLFSSNGKLSNDDWEIIINNKKSNNENVCDILPLKRKLID
jgi:hypothetical protein